MRARTIIAVAAGLLLALSGWAGSNAKGSSSSQLSKADQKFVKQAVKAGQAEVAMGRLGVQKAQSPAVKEYAQRLIDEHTKANAALQQLAARKGLALNSQPASKPPSDKTTERTRVREQADTPPDHSQHAGMKRLQTLSGSDFDREFIRMAVNDHQKDVKDFEKQAQKAQDPELKAFAQRSAPTLREHLQQARSIESQLNAGAAGRASGSTRVRDKSP